MRRWLARFAAGLALAATAAQAQPGPPSPEVRLTARDTLELSHAGALAAFALDVSLVEATVAGGKLLLAARRAGRTIVTVVTASGVDTLQVTIDAPPPLFAGARAAEAAGGGSWDARYDTATRRFASGLAAQFTLGERIVKLRAEALREGDAGSEGWALPFASVSIESPGQSLVLLDHRLQGSRLVHDQVIVRGVHLRRGAVSVNAGVASNTPYDDLFLPSSGDRIATAAVELPHGQLRFVPRVAWLPDGEGAAKGLAGLTIAHGQPGDALSYSAEVAWGGRPAAAIDVQLNDPRRQASLSAAVRPQGFPTLRATGRAPGHHADGAWTEWIGERASVTAIASQSRVDVPGLESRAASARVELRTRTSGAWSLDASVGAGTFRSGEVPELRRATVTAGASYDLPGFGAAVQYRYQETSAAERGGHGGRLSVHGRSGGWRGSAFVDAQQQAPTLDLVLRDRSDVARALAGAGLTATNPEDLVRLMRDNPALFTAAGITLGELRTSPLRLQAGLDLAWRGASGGPEVGVRLLADDAEAVASRRRAYSVTAHATWPLSPRAEVGLAYTRWSMRRFSDATDDRGSVQAWLRTRFDEPSLPGMFTAEISGRVMALEGEGKRPLEGVEVLLDRSRRTQTDKQGRFTFERAGSGARRVEAVLPRAAGAYFTSSSSRTVKPGEEAEFTVAFAGARLHGVVKSDGGAPLEGVRVRLDGPAQLATQTDSSGHFSFDAPAGAARVGLVAESIPAGYDLRDLPARHLELSPAAPAAAEFIVRAQRSVKGRVTGGGGAARVVVLETGREVATDAEGRFVVAGLPAGIVTLVARGERGESRVQLEMPAGPASRTGITLALPR